MATQTFPCGLIRDNEPLPRCLAFLKGIPDTILNVQFDHRNAYPGDQGIYFKSKTAGGEEMYAFYFQKQVEEKAVA